MHKTFYFIFCQCYWKNVIHNLIWFYVRWIPQQCRNNHLKKPPTVATNTWRYQINPYKLNNKCIVECKENGWTGKSPGATNREGTCSYSRDFWAVTVAAGGGYNIRVRFTSWISWAFKVHKALERWPWDGTTL